MVSTTMNGRKTRNRITEAEPVDPVEPVKHATPARRRKEAKRNKDAKPAGPLLIVIPEKRRERITLRVKGISPLLVCRFSAKALGEIEETMALEDGEPRRERSPLDLQAMWEQARYRGPGKKWDGVSVLGFKAAMVAACRHLTGVHMIECKQLIHVYGDANADDDGTPIVRICDARGKPIEPRVFKNWVRVGKKPNQVAMPRWRPMYEDWYCTLTISYLANRIKPQSVVNLLAFAGDGGIGDWRPSSPNNNTGSFGVFDVVPED